MIKEHIVNGSKETTLHSFSITTNGMDIVITGGEYWRAGEVLFSDADGGTLSVPTTPDTSYVAFIMSDGISVFQYTNIDDLFEFTENNKATIIDKIIWFDISSNVTSLDNVEINFLRVVDNAD